MAASPSFSVSTYEGIMRTIREFVDEKGLEAYPFKIKWYNHRVTTPFQLPYSDDTLAVLLVSTPAMFESLLYPFILSNYDNSGDKNQSQQTSTSNEMDPIDKCLKNEIFLKLTTTFFKEHQTTFIQDHELTPSRRPKILLQTAGHVSGSAYYYQRGDVPESPWATSTNIYGVSVHPKYGGWFAFRGVLIFQNVTLPEEDVLVYKDPPKCVSERERIVELLEKFNFSWQDWTYRDVLDTPVCGRYSEKQKEYFATLPKDRCKLVKKWIAEEKGEGT